MLLCRELVQVAAANARACKAMAAGGGPYLTSCCQALCEPASSKTLAVLNAQLLTIAMWGWGFGV